MSKIWLPITKDEMIKRGWSQLDVIIISGDAYVDHPSFGHAIIARNLEKLGFKVGIIPQPNWRDDLRDFKKFGPPKYFFGITSGCMDSMVAHYTTNKRKRSNDAYTPKGEAGFRPDYATTVYSKIIKQIYPDIPVIIGGVEASLRRVTHYDYFKDMLLKSILIDSEADLLVYGNGEKPILDIANLFKKNVPLNNIKTIPQIAYLLNKEDELPKNKKWIDLKLHSHERCIENKKDFADNFIKIEKESNRDSNVRFVQEVDKLQLIINPPYKNTSSKEIDGFYNLPFTRMPHPKYLKRGQIPAYEMIRHSVTSHRGCFGGCSFCSIAIHQGKKIISRSSTSILKEIVTITKMDDFKGYISDIGGPSANMYKMEGINLDQCSTCLRPSCISPDICKNLNISHKDLLVLYNLAKKIEGIKKIHIGSGIRYDLLESSDELLAHQEYLEVLIKEHVSGQLKVAPEHTEDQVLRQMRKPSFNKFISFKKRFEDLSKKFNLNQFIIPYFISSHPGSDLSDMAHLAKKTSDLGYKLEQIQDFLPTPMTLSTVCYYTGINPYTGKKIYTAKTKDEKLNQRKMFFWYKNENKSWIADQLKKLKIIIWF